MMAGFARFCRRPLVVWLVALAVFLAALPWFSRDLGFSWHFHADEGGKIAQVQMGERNFHHPLLMLHCVQGVVALTGANSSPHAIVLAGRWVAVVAMALACALLVAAVGMSHGAGWGLVLGVLLLLHPACFTYAHYFKEDPMLLAGLALAILGVAVAGQGGRGWRRGCLITGCGLGLALGSKYIGIVWWPFVLAALAAHAPVPQARRAGWLLAFGLAVAIVLIIQLPAFVHAGQFTAAVSSEVTKATKDSVGAEDSGSVVQIYWAGMRRMPLVAFAALALAGTVVAAGFRRWPAFWLGLSSWGYLAILCAATKEADRYLLPWHVAVTVATVVIIAAICRSIGTRLRGYWRVLPAVVALALLVDVASDLRDLQKIAVNGFRNMDRRVDAIEFIRKELPAGAVVFYGTRVGLVDPAYPEQYPAALAMLPQQVRYVPEPWTYGTVAGMRAAGATHYLVSEEFERAERMSRIEEKQAFFRDFRQHAKLIQQFKRGSKSQFPMRLSLYDLAGDR